MKKEELLDSTYIHAANTIKEAILSAQYEAARGVNNIQLMLYYAIGRYISANSRKGHWGTDAIGTISRLLRTDMPGLRGYSESNIKRMRGFFEEWIELDPLNGEPNSPIQTDDLSFTTDNIGNEIVTISPIQMGEIQASPIPANLTDEIAILPFNFPAIDAFPANDFRSIGFTHHCNILAQCKSREQRLFYISLCARDIEEVNESVVEQKIVDNIKKFILRFGKEFLFVENQYTITVAGHDHRIDLLFFNRELNCLVAIELKTGEFKQIYLGELNGYLRLLDDYVRKPHENPSIGIVLCKSADRTYVEYMIQDYDKPMGVATYKTATDMPERLRNALPSQEVLMKLMEKE